MLNDGRTVTSDGNNGLNINGGEKNGSFNIDNSVLGALANQPLVSKGEKAFLEKGIQAGLNLANQTDKGVTLKFDPKAKGTEPGAGGDRNNSVQLSFAGLGEGNQVITPQGGKNQLSIDAIAKAADGSLSINDAGDLKPTAKPGFLAGLEAGQKGRDLAANAFQAAFAGAGVKADAPRLARSEERLKGPGNLFPGAGERSQKLDANPTEALRDNTVNALANGVKAKIAGPDQAGELRKLGFNDKQIGKILQTDNEGNVTVNDRQLKKALEGRVRIDSKAGEAGKNGEAGGFTLTAVVQGGKDASGDNALSSLVNPGSTEPNNIVGKVEVTGEGANARAAGTGTGQTVDGNSIGENIGSKVAVETARRLSLSSSQGGLGVGKINSKDLVFGENGDITGINVGGKTLTVDEFANAKAADAQRIAARRNDFGLGKNGPEVALNAEQIKALLVGGGDNKSIAQQVKEEGGNQIALGDLAGASTQARATYNALISSGGFDASKVQRTVNKNGSISLAVGNDNFTINKDGSVSQTQPALSPGSEGGNAGNGNTPNQSTALGNLAQATGANLEDFSGRKQKVDDLIADLNNSFQVNFGLFKIGEKVDNINVEFDDNGDIKSAGVRLDDGSSLQLAKDPNTGELIASNARDKNGNAAGQSVSGSTNFFNKGQRQTGFKNVLEGLGAEDISIKEFDNSQEALKLSDNNPFNNNFTQNGNISFKLNGERFRVDYAVDKNGGLSLDLDELNASQQEALKTALGKTNGNRNARK